MMKFLKRKKTVSYEFAVQVETLKDGNSVYTPVMRRKVDDWSLFSRLDSAWERIVFIEGRYLTLDVPWASELSEEECQVHIINYMNQLRKTVSDHIVDTKFKNLEIVEI